MGFEKDLQKLICDIKSKVSGKMLSADDISGWIKRIKDMGFKEYDVEKFPPLKDLSGLSDKVPDTPSSLAEALLWKLGRWKAYTAFVANYGKQETAVSARGGVVFSAFAKHLQDKKSPIYDQHAIRAIWAICSLKPEESEKCKHLLFDGKGKWKKEGSGDDGSCYEIFVHYVKELCAYNIDNEKLDRLLMPLGQAIKKKTGKKGESNNSTDYERFQMLCLWPVALEGARGCCDQGANVGSNQSRGRDTTKKAKAMNIYIENPNAPRGLVIQRFIVDVGLTKAGASTYYENFRSGKWK